MATFSTEPMPGIVLQCGSCRAIVGDTAPADFVGVCSLDDAQLVVIRGGCSLVRAAEADRALVRVLGASRLSPLPPAHAAAAAPQPPPR
jgi:hypothetical protein